MASTCSKSQATHCQIPPPRKEPPNNTVGTNTTKNYVDQNALLNRAKLLELSL